MSKFFKPSFRFFLYYYHLGLDCFSFACYIADSRKKKKFNFLYFHQPYWYTEFIIGLFFLCFLFFFVLFVSYVIFSIFRLFFFIFFLFLVWLTAGYFLLCVSSFFYKHKVLHALFFYVFSFLNYFFDYHDGRFFGFLCDFIFWYFRAMNVPFSFLLKVRYSYERICFYIFCSLCSVISILVFVPSFISENL